MALIWVSAMLAIRMWFLDILLPYSYHNNTDIYVTLFARAASFLLVYYLVLSALLANKRKSKYNK